MRIVFIGAVEFSRHCLGEILEAGGEVVAALTLPSERARFNSDYADLSDIASAHGVPVYHVRNINDPETIDLIRSLRPDIIFVFGWSQLVSSAVLEIPPKGCVGTHPALLPKNRGRHPLIWALVEGLTESGLTFFYLDEGADSGDILWQRPFPITLEDDARSLYDKIKNLASIAIAEFLPQLTEANPQRRVQNHDEASYWRKRDKSDGELHWNLPTVTSYNLIRALAAPYVGAHTFVGTQQITIWRARLPERSIPQEASQFPPGTVFRHDAGEFDVRTGDGFLTITEYTGAESEHLEGARLGDGQ